MTAIDSDRSFARQHLTVVCPCGRNLRAKVDQAGSEIRCWDCQKMVSVPIPRSRFDALRAVSQGWREVFEVPSLVKLFVGAALLTGMLAIPRLGLSLGAAVLVVAVFGYGELIRQSILATREEAERPGPVRLLGRGVMALLVGLSLLAPFILSPTGIGHAPRFPGLTPLLAALGAVLLPLGMLAAFGGPTGPRLALATVRWRPWATVLALAIVPLAIILLEALVFFVCHHFNLLALLLLELFPNPRGLCQHLGIRINEFYGFGVPPEANFVSMYLFRLRQGYLLSGAIPPSLAIPRRFVYADFWQGDTSSEVYFVVRIILTQAIAMVGLTALALQARWLGLIAATEAKATTARREEAISAA